ncbi:unnamed protein product [Musa hybrid cultivar]
MGPRLDPVADRTADTAPLVTENKGADEYLTVRWNQDSNCYTTDGWDPDVTLLPTGQFTTHLASLSASSREWEGGSTRAGKQRRR